MSALDQLTKITLAAPVHYTAKFISIICVCPEAAHDLLVGVSHALRALNVSVGVAGSCLWNILAQTPSPKATVLQKASLMSELSPKLEAAVGQNEVILCGNWVGMVKAFATLNNIDATWADNVLSGILTPSVTIFLHIPSDQILTSYEKGNALNCGVDKTTMISRSAEVAQIVLNNSQSLGPKIVTADFNDLGETVSSVTKFIMAEIGYSETVS